MMLTTKARYAVMAVFDIAVNSEEGTPIKLSTVARGQNISVRFLEQIFNKLKASGLVRSVRGPGGGYMLAKPASEITVDDIIDAVDENIEMTRCKQHANCGPMNSKCISHNLWCGLSS